MKSLLAFLAITIMLSSCIDSDQSKTLKNAAASNRINKTQSNADSVLDDIDN